MRAIALAGVMVLSTGCAAIFGSKQQDLRSAAPALPRAEVLSNGSRVGTTPVVGEAQQPEGAHFRVPERSGYKEASCTLMRSTGAGWVILDILGGLIPVAIDAATRQLEPDQGLGVDRSGKLEPMVCRFSWCVRRL